METTQEARSHESSPNDIDQQENKKTDNPNQLDGAGDSLNNSVPEDNQTSKNSSEESGSNTLHDGDDDSEWETVEEVDLSDSSNDEDEFHCLLRRAKQQKSKCPKQEPHRHAAILQLKITLKYYRPKIWRRILVSSLDTFEDLHNHIQLAMGWWGCHLHEFSVRDRSRGCKIEIISDRAEEESNSQLDLLKRMLGVPSYETLKEKKVQLFKFLRKPGDYVTYMYDFGDGWTHRVVVEEVLPYDTKGIYPKCIAGEKACPPEDCGGVSGYKRLLEVRPNPEHECYKDLITDWLDEYYPNFDPDKFEPDFTGFYF